MKIYTAQIAQWRKINELGLELHDTTVKSGDKLLAPTWDMVSRYKAGSLDTMEYTELYLDLLRNRYRQNPQYFHTLVSRPSLVIGCYCPANSFCHRILLKDILIKLCAHLNISCEYIGEITRTGVIK